MKRDRLSRKPNFYGLGVAMLSQHIQMGDPQPDDDSAEAHQLRADEREGLTHQQEWDDLKRRNGT